MADIDLYEAYNSKGDSLRDLFGETGEGFFVPLFQRKYTWEEDNINQLFDDVIQGIIELSDTKGDNAATFLGSVILTTLTNKKNTVVKGEERAELSSVQLVIDGQQRISTFALIAIQLWMRLKTLKEGLSDKPPYLDLKNCCDDLIEKLLMIYASKCRHGANPLYKPKIIRAEEDHWTYDGDDCCYGSSVACYTAAFIRSKDLKFAYDSVDAVKGARVRGNVDLINQWLDQICDAHISGTQLNDQFPIGKQIATERMQKYILGFSDKQIKAIVEKSETNKNEIDYSAVAIYHVFLVVYYLLNRCGVNRLQPTREEWGFDMFQALNSTGTPLTAMETFLPQVMQAEEKAGKDWTKTESQEYMDEIDKLFVATESNEQKNRRTNELLGTFALCYEGNKLGNKFSAQRKWLARRYETDLPTIDEKRTFLKNLSHAAHFYFAGWYMEEDASKPHHILGLEDHKEGELTALLVQFLKNANSKLSAPILTRFYSQIEKDKSATLDEFAEATKACAAFFTLWRSAKSTSGLDEIYRRYFKGSNAPVVVDKHSWESHPLPIASKDLKQYFMGVLKQQDLDDKNKWIEASERFLLYSELKSICRFVLFIASHDRVADSSKPGLTVPGTKGVCSLLKLSKWSAKDYKTLEHIAPQTPPNNHKWDKNIYLDQKVHHIGNLMLLPMDVNKIVDNKNWETKYLHYSHTGVREKAKIEQLSGEAKKKGIILSKKAVNTLSKTEYSCSVEPILTVGPTGPWDAQIIDKRTQQIKEIAWETLISWLKT